jgi:hypothetical protein
MMAGLTRFATFAKPVPKEFVPTLPMEKIREKFTLFSTGFRHFKAE